MCERLVGTFNVHVVCGQPNNPTQEDYRREGVEVRSGVSIYRLKHTQFSKSMPAGRLMNLLSFSRSAARYLSQTKLQSDVIICETDPFFLPVVAAKHARRTGSKLVCYLQDIYPDVAESIGKVKPGLLTSQIRSRLKSAYLTSDAVVVLGNCMRQRLQSPPWSLPTDKLQVIPNWADCHAIHPLPMSGNPFRQREQLEDRFVVMHSGNMGLTQRLDIMLEAVRSSTWPVQATLGLVGEGAGRRDLEQLAVNIPHDRVRFLPYQPREQLAESLSAADLHVVSMHENITGCLCPSKLYGILAAGRPVLSIASEQTDLHQTVSSEKLGWCCRPGDATGIATAVAEAASNSDRRLASGRRAREIACEQFDREVVTTRFAELLSALTEKCIDRSMSSRPRQAPAI